MGARARQQARRDDAVLKAAGELFLVHGYAPTTIPMIAERAGLAVGTVAKVGSKDALFLRVAEAQGTAETLDRIAELMQQPISLTEKFSTFFLASLDAAAAFPTPVKDYLVAYLRAADHLTHRQQLVEIIDPLTLMFGVDDISEGSPARVAALTMYVSSIGLVFALVAGTATLDEVRRLQVLMVEAVCRPFERSGREGNRP